MGSQFKVITPPASEPLQLATTKQYLRVDFSDDDALIGGLISRARSYAETVTGRALATQTVQQVFTIERPSGGELSGPINKGPSWYQYQEQLGSNPFGASQFYFDLAMPPIQVSQPITVETRITAFGPWVTFPQVTNPDGSTNTWIDDTSEPGRMYFMSPVTANFWRFTFTAGYSNSYPLPFDLQQCLYELIAYWYDNREAEDLPQPILNKLTAKRVNWI